LIGSSPKFRAVLEEVETVASADCAVLIRGETGTGKEVIAKSIHDASPRRQHRFVAINCAAIPAALLESELFGHERGAFTGAVTPRMGRFKAADRGTLFLDEIGELPIELQPKLLRVLQEREFERLGSSQTTRVDVRIVAATNQDLWGMVRQHRFRADLYYRLNVFPITLPPLREREGDIPLLVAHFLRIFAERQHKSIERIPDDVMKALERYDWPGNIRELQNFIERSVILTKGVELRSPLAQLTNQEMPDGNVCTLADADRAHILATLHKTNWIVGGRNGAAARLGMKRTTLIAKMRKLRIAREAEQNHDPFCSFDRAGGAAPKRGSCEGENGPENGPEPKTTNERQIQIYQPHRSLREPQSLSQTRENQIERRSFIVCDSMCCYPSVEPLARMPDSGNKRPMIEIDP
jgi:formate hydrogenlyase transcriptional activator